MNICQCNLDDGVSNRNKLGDATFVKTRDEFILKSEIPLIESC